MANNKQEIVIPKPKPKPTQQPTTQQSSNNSSQSTSTGTASGYSQSTSTGTASGYSQGTSTGTSSGTSSGEQNCGPACQQAQDILNGSGSWDKNLSILNYKSDIPSGYYVAYEDEDNYYCLPFTTIDDREIIVKKLETNASITPISPIRKEALRLAKSMVKNNAKYKFGAPINEFLGDCEKAASFPVDCSSLVQWVYDSAVCVVDGFCMATSKKALPFKDLRTSLDQYNMFQKKNALTLTPEGGDVIFFKKTNGDTKPPVNHVGIFMTKEGNDIWMIHASTGAGKVVLVRYPINKWGLTVVGYGSLSKLLP